VVLSSLTKATEVRRRKKEAAIYAEGFGRVNAACAHFWRRF